MRVPDSWWYLRSRLRCSEPREVRSLCANRSRVRSEFAPIGVEGGIERDLGGSRQPDINWSSTLTSATCPRPNFAHFPDASRASGTAGTDS